MGNFTRNWPIGWIGHATFLIKLGDTTIITDPVFSKNAGPLIFGPKRYVDPALNLDEIPKIDLFLLTHNHYDHQDMGTIRKFPYKNAEIVLLGNLHPSTQLSVLEQMNSKPKLVILDTMNYWMDNSLDELVNVISKVDLLCINDQEAEQLTGESDLKIAAKKISKLGPKFLIIKKGEFGSLVFGEDDYYNCPIFPTEIVKDPTGAGDTFAGGLAGYLASCSEISFDEVKKGVMYGTAIASYCIEDFGPNNIMNLDINLIEQRVSKIKK